MQGIEFEEEKDLIRSPENVRTKRTVRFDSNGNVSGYKISKKEKNTVITLLILSFILCLISGILFFLAHKKMNYLGKVTPVESLTDVELYQLPENIRVYIQKQRLK